MSNYYFLSCMLPVLHLGKAPELSFRELEPLLKFNLSVRDFEKVRTIRHYYDIQNIRHYWKKEPFVSYGNMDVAELEEVLVSRLGLPAYVYEFLEKYVEPESRIHHFPRLVADFYREEWSEVSQFLGDYFSLMREVRLVFQAFRAKNLGKDLAEELQYEDPYDPLVAQILAQKDAPTFQPPVRYEPLKPLFDQYKDNPIQLHKAFCEYRFKKIDAMIEGDLFSIDRILAYLIQLVLVEEWLKLDKDKGLEIVDRMMKDIT